MAPARGYGGGDGLADSPAALAIPSITEKKNILYETYLIFKKLLNSNGVSICIHNSMYDLYRFLHLKDRTLL